MLMKSSMAALAIGAVLSATSAHAKCTTVSDHIKTAKIVATGVCAVAGIVSGSCDPVAAYQTMDKADKTVHKAMERWKELGKNGPGKLGPRIIRFGKAERGKVLTKRAFIGDQVVDGTVTVTIKHTKADKSRLVAKLCAIGKGDKPVERGEIVFDKKSPAGDVLKGQINLNNEMLMIDMRAPRVGGTFSYEVVAKVQN